jgi:hypothetical protein
MQVILRHVTQQNVNNNFELDVQYPNDKKYGKLFHICG